MRVTQYSAFNPYKSALDEIQNRKYREETRISTGKNIISISDSPKEASQAKQMSFLIDKNEQYGKNIQESIDEIQTSYDTLQNISDKFQKIHELSIDTTHVGNIGNLNALASYIKGVLKDVVNDANTDFNGTLIFSGTKTNPSSIEPGSSTSNHLPFELKEGSATPDNLSGMTIVFRGDFNDREISKDASSTEIVNNTADDIFGAGGTDAIKNIVDLYNLISFKADGTERKDTDVYTTEETDKLNTIQKNILDSINRINNIAAKNGAKLNRLDTLKEQNQAEITRIKSNLSSIQDTDYAQASLNLTKETNSLQFALQAGTKLIQQTLFDFLS